MKIKLSGTILKHAMDYNEIIISADEVSIHNSNNTGYGFMHKYKMPVSVKEEISMILNKKDYVLLGNMQEFMLEKSGDVIQATAVGFKAMIADMKDIHMIQPDVSDLRKMKITYSDIYRGKAFAGNTDKTKIQLDGATIRNDKIVISSGTRFYQKTISNNTHEINIPFDVFKHLDPSEDYKILTNKKFAVFMTGGLAFYTNTIEILIDIPTIDDAGKIEFKVDKDDLISKLKLLKSYVNIVEIDAEGSLMEMTASSEGNEINLKIPITPVKLKKAHIGWNVADIIAILSIAESGEVKIKVTDKMVIIGNKNENIVAFAGLVVCQGMEVTGNE